MAKPLSERIASARSTDRINIKDLEQLIADAVAERDRLSAASVRASAESVDFTLSDQERDDAAALSDRYSRAAKGLASEIATLTDKLEAKRNSEAQRVKAAERAEIIAERDALVERFKAEWPLLEAQIVDLLTELKRVTARMHGIGTEPEVILRGVDATLGRSGARSLLETRLPAFSNPQALAWPPPERSTGPHWTEQIRLQRVRAEEAKAAENARWSEFIVTPPSGRKDQWPSIRHRGGVARPDRAGVVSLTAELAEEAREAGYQVELANGRTVAAGPPSAAVF